MMYIKRCFLRKIDTINKIKYIDSTISKIIDNFTARNSVYIIWKSGKVSSESVEHGLDSYLSKFQKTKWEF